jgi:acyl-CoA thioesterase-1
LLYQYCVFVGVQFSQAQKVIVRQPVKFLALGDSYTIGQSVSQDQSWPYQFKNYLEGKGVEFDAIKVIAQTGWTTSNLKNAIENENLNEKFNLVSLLIGVNNQYQGLNKDLYVTRI